MQADNNSIRALNPPESFRNDHKLDHAPVIYFIYEKADFIVHHSLFMGCASLPTDYLELDNQKALSLDSVMEKISKERVIFISEIHGTASIHLLQLEIIKRLRQSGKELVIALEAFSDTRQ